MPETNRVEYKEKLTKDLDLEREVIAFLNYLEGGFIYIGIDKYGEILGLDDIDGDMLKIKERIKNNISSSAMGLFDVVAEESDGTLLRLLLLMAVKIPILKGNMAQFNRNRCHKYSEITGTNQTGIFN